MNCKVMAQEQQIRTPEEQIIAAVRAAPEAFRAEATVLGYKADTVLTTLREGTSTLVCLADDPRSPDFHVACYHKDLEPFMKRGRELKAKGMSRKEVDLIRRSEIKSGELPMPEKPMALYSLSGNEEAFDYEKKEVNEASPRYVIYIPYATEATSGLSKSPASEGAPWIMEPGTPWAHIMVLTGREIEQ
ncbi:hypothetical protein [Fodinibius salsisoli]|uniref:Uncharacterized protein n=1 Tax=Fodinibius salsisoli TaxID=2820877 RepID=A0ABT3PRF6_9BACT|nr:hypothetical protein [Fodinibius salsisoli]MCW9708421.1 hypothetical protein [Fodinibius salsisoli]